MLRDIMIFVLGGYALPAFYFGYHVWRAERSDSDLTGLEKVVTVVLAGITWPLSPLEAHPDDNNITL